MVDARVGVGFEPHLSATATAAEGILAATRHLDQIDIRILQQFTRLLIDVVVAAQIARVMIGDVAVDALPIGRGAGG